MFLTLFCHTVCHPKVPSPPSHTAKKKTLFKDIVEIEKLQESPKKSVENGCFWAWYIKFEYKRIRKMQKNPRYLGITRTIRGIEIFQKTALFGDPL